MVALNTAYVPSETLERSQNRVGDFFREGTDRVGKNRLSSCNQTGESGLTITIIVSGRSSWLSRDPIAENGGINLYAYVLNNPINWWDPWGLEVYIGARGLNAFGGNAAVHTFVEVRDSDGSKTTYGGYKDGDNLAVRENDPSDSGTPNKGYTEVPPPPGMTQEEWDQAVKDSAEREKEKDGKREYKPRGGDGGNKSGNCNSTTSDILEGAGGSVPTGYDPRGYNPGLRVPKKK